MIPATNTINEMLETKFKDLMIEPYEAELVAYYLSGSNIIGIVDENSDIDFTIATKGNSHVPYGIYHLYDNKSDRSISRLEIDLSTCEVKLKANDKYFDSWVAYLLTQLNIASLSDCYDRVRMQATADICKKYIKYLMTDLYYTNEYLIEQLLRKEIILNIKPFYHLAYVYFKENDLEINTDFIMTLKRKPSTELTEEDYNLINTIVTFFEQNSLEVRDCYTEIAENFRTELMLLWR